MKTIVSMNDQGRMTVPAAARQALRVDGATKFELEVTDGTLILRPAIVIPREDAWAYEPEYVLRLEQAVEQVRRGETRRLTEDDLKRLAQDQV